MFRIRSTNSQFSFDTSRLDPCFDVARQIPDESADLPELWSLSHVPPVSQSADFYRQPI